MSETTYTGSDPTVEFARRRVGTVLRDKWQITALLGVGGMAAVYSATHRNGKRAALKILHREFCAQPQFVTRFLREGYVANKIDHPASVSILDDEVCEDGTVFLVMELLQGTSLDRFTRRRDKRRLPLPRILGIADDVLDLLRVAHSHGIIHRDLKPANIFLTSNDQVKVLDFGIARLAERALDGSATQTGAAMGTPAFMPPEQARGRWNLVDARTDLWAVGATTFALIVGDRPRRAETVQEELLLAMTTPLPSLAATIPNFPPELAAWVDRSVSFEIEARYPDAATMQQALRALLQSGVSVRQDGPGAVETSRSKSVSDVPQRLEAPSQPTGPFSDTAPRVMEGAEPVGPPTHLTASGTMGTPRPAPHGRVLWATVAALVLGVAAGAGIIITRSKAPTPLDEQATAATRSAETSSPPTPTNPSVGKEIPLPPASPAENARPTATAATVEAVVPVSAPAPAPAASPSATIDAAAPAASSPSHRREHGKSVGQSPSLATPPPAPTPAATINPLDQRF